jgi:hypothetical protein
MVQKNHPHSKNKGKAVNKPIKTTTFKKKKTTKATGACYTCGDGEHFARDCPNHADRKEKASNGTGSKTINTVTMSNIGEGMVIYLLSFQYFNLLVGGLIWVLMSTCVLISLFILLTRSLGFLPS